jgi:hypothetical protein
VLVLAEGAGVEPADPEDGTTGVADQPGEPISGSPPHGRELG